MKNILLLLVAAPLTCFPQQAPGHGELQSIAEMEKKAAVAFVQNKNQSLSSNNFDIHYYRCQWNVDPNVRYIKGIITSAFTITSSTNSISLDCNDQLNVDSILYHGSPINFQRGQPGLFTVQFSSTLS